MVTRKSPAKTTKRDATPPAGVDRKPATAKKKTVPKRSAAPVAAEPKRAAKTSKEGVAPKVAGAKPTRRTKAPDVPADPRQTTASAPSTRPRIERKRASRTDKNGGAGALRPIHCLMDSEPLVQVLWPAEVWCKRCRSWHSLRF